jgi:hypothetical protein
MDDFVNQSFPDIPLMRREVWSLRPPIFKNISGLAVIMGETGYSRHNLGLVGSAKNAISPANLEVILKIPPRIKIRG